MSCCSSHRICIPTKENFLKLHRSVHASTERLRVTGGSLENMVKLDGGPFLMGSESRNAIVADGEGPVRKVIVSPFYISKYPVTNDEFAAFVEDTKYVTDAEKDGASFVFQNHVRELGTARAAETPWFRIVNKASWFRPEGRGSNINSRGDRPVVHVSWFDAMAYCKWANVRLPLEAEWEFACRGGLEQKGYWWGDEFLLDGVYRCNIYQGDFPNRDTGEDGYTNLAPVDAYVPNAFGLFVMLGNQWEWCLDFFDATFHRGATRTNPTGPESGTHHVMRGGSFICHPSYCHRYRNSARIGSPPGTTTEHLGFRVVMDVA